MSTKIIAQNLGIDWDKDDEKNVPLTEEEEVVDDEQVDCVSDDVEERGEEEEETGNEDLSSSSSGQTDAVTEFFGPEQKIGHVEEDYEFTRRKMRAILTKGEQALNGALDMVNEDPSTRGYEVFATMLKAVSDVSVSYFDLQKRNRDLHQGGLASIGGKPQSIQMQNGIVFTGDSATMLEQLKARKKAKQENNDDKT